MKSAVKNGDYPSHCKPHHQPTHGRPAKAMMSTVLETSTLYSSISRLADIQISKGRICMDQRYENATLAGLINSLSPDYDARTIVSHV